MNKFFKGTANKGTGLTPRICTRLATGGCRWLTALAAGLVLTAHGAQVQTLRGHLLPAVKTQRQAGRLADTNRLNLAIGLPLRNPAGLSNLLHQIYDPRSTNYHRYLTPEQFTERFGPSEQDYQNLIAFAKSNHLHVTSTHANRMVLSVSGTARQVENALQVHLNTYQHPSEKRMFFAPDVEPSLSVSMPVLHVSGLDNFALPRPMAHPAVSPHPTGGGSGPSGFLLGKDFRNAYAPDVTLTGTGESVGLLQFESGYYQSDITAYENLAGLPNVPVQAILLGGYGGGPGTKYPGGNVEASLDIEMAISMAPGLSHVYVYEGVLTDDILSAMAASNQVRQLSASWYYPIDATTEQIYQQFAAQGQSFFNASGDYNGWDTLGNPAPTPLDDPYITIVGGTTLSMNGSSYGSETAWNWGVAGTGGGISINYPIPSWQTNINTGANQASTTMRNMPDVAMPADQVWVTYGNGSSGYEGGTSCASPLWAGFAALCNQQAILSGQPSVGFINPAVYAIASGPNYSACFHDITTGNNNWFNAVVGYDLCTGVGSPTGQNLINALSNPDSLAIHPAIGFNASGAVGGPFFPATFQNYTLTNSGSNTLSWTLSNTSVWLTASASTGTLTPGGPATVVTISLNTIASNLVVGAYNATLCFSNQNDNFTRYCQFQLSVLAPPVITQQPTNVAVLGNTTAGFNVQVTGGSPLVYQWLLNGTNLTDGGSVSGAATANLIISNMSDANVGTYTAVVTNTAGIAVSSNAMLTIIPSPPIVILQPTNVTVGAKGPATFAVGAIGTLPYTYQWIYNGASLPGATNSALTFPSVQPGNAGSYAVLITNMQGSIQSSNATLTIAPCVPVPSGIVAWWSAEGDATDGFGANHGTLKGPVTYASGELGQAFSFQATKSYVQVPGSPSLNVGLGSGFTIEGWINPMDVISQQIIVEWHKINATNSGVYLQCGQSYGTGPGALLANLIDSKGKYRVIRTDADVIVTNQFQHVGLTYDAASGISMLYVNGSMVAQESLGTFTPQTSYDIFFGERPTNQVTFAGIYNYKGLQDEMSIYNRALSSNEIYAIFFARGRGKCGMAPVITLQPTNRTVTAGGATVFAVSATGSKPLEYQWTLNGVSLSNATNTTLSLSGVQVTNAGNYSATVSNNTSTTNSANALLTVLDILDHFAWSDVPSPRFANSPFAATVQAMDPANLLFTNFNGSVSITTTNGILVAPATSGNFAQGTWTGLLNISQAVSNMVLRADDGAGHSGLANAINVVGTPNLGVVAAGSSLTFSWPAVPAGFVLETATNLIAPQWIPVNPPASPSGGMLVQQVQTGSANQFYRLRYTLP